MGKITFVVAINREYGSGGSEIAYKLGKLLGVNVYDRGILDSLTQQFNLTVEDTARKRIEIVDKARENYTKTFAGVSRYDARNYDFVINVSHFSTDSVANFLAANIRKKYPNL